MSALAGTLRAKAVRLLDATSPQLDLRAADLASLLMSGASVTRWPNKGTTGAPQDAVPAGTAPTFVSDASGGAVYFAGNDYLRLATLFDDPTEQLVYGLAPRLVSVVFSSPTYRAVAGYGGSSFLDFAADPPGDVYAPGFVYIPGQVITAPVPAASATTVLSAWIYPDASFASGMAIQVFTNEQVSAGYEFANGQKQEDFYIGRCYNSTIPLTGQLYVRRVRVHCRVLLRPEARALHNELR